MKINILKSTICAFLMSNISLAMEQSHIAKVFTLESYRRLSPSEKESLNKEFQDTFKKPIELGALGTVYYILNNPSNIGRLISVARELNNRYQNSVIVSLGQSPAYIVKAAEILNELENNRNQNRFTYLAFSGGFLKTKDDFLQHKQDRMFYPEGSLPTENQLITYERYLKLLQLDPTAIVNRFIAYQKPTIFVEYTQSGTSLASFIYTLNVLALKEGINLDLLKKAILYHTLQPLIQARILGVALTSISLGIAPYTHVSLENIQIPDNDLMVGLANADMFDDRLVPHYFWMNWEKINPQKFNLSKNANLVLFKIINQISIENEINIFFTNLVNSPFFEQWQMVARRI